MEPDDLKTAWQSLETRMARMARSDAIQLALLRDTRLVRAKAQLRPLKIGQWLQAALGLGLILLGVACWTRNIDVTGLLVAGIAIHAFGVLTIIGATATLVLAGRIDYAAPVLQIQRQLAALLRVIWQPVMFSMAMVAVIYPLYTVLSNGGHAPQTILMIVTLTGAVIYGALIMLFSKAVVQSCKQMIGMKTG